MNYHAVNTAFNLTVKGELIGKFVVREAKIITDGQGNIYRESCKGCAFSKLVVDYSCGYGRASYQCKIHGAELTKCTPEYREDGKYIEYKKVNL